MASLFDRAALSLSAALALAGLVNLGWEVLWAWGIPQEQWVPLLIPLVVAAGILCLGLKCRLEWKKWSRLRIEREAELAALREGEGEVIHE